ncbi:right-handed parallel beta-helix repeat-containing protein [Legionella clemsonensis]|uniref:Right handed beta helix domain-containing protein n=1 Tax=Legionella clemsonensis TaxID=1867846 RepID=A0A222NZ70_9GAMM|nr:right-handed parallel beta-helix repeat-containing protein [Legionella clemsonensis]ASQ44876.1 hypothetical protein clem_01560 [Legionella clemsonensis]
MDKIVNINQVTKWISALFLLLSYNIAQGEQHCFLLESNVISAPGCYYLKKDMQGSITISSDSVTLDLNGRKLSDPNPGSWTIGVNLENRNNITIKNGYFDGFWFAISASGGRNIHIQNNVFINTKYMAITASGSNVNVLNNHISYMDFYLPKDSINFYLVGLNIRDTTGCNILNNVIYAPSLPANPPKFRLEYVGLILSSSSRNCRIKNNVFSNFKLPKFKSIAVWLASDTQGSYLRDNLILNYGYGIIGKRGSYLDKNNLSVNVTTPTWDKSLTVNNVKTNFAF